MNPFKLTDEERRRIQEKHNQATKSEQDRKDRLKQGLKEPEKKNKDS